MLNTERDEIFTPHGTVRLRPLTPGDTELVHGWLTDPPVSYTHLTLPTNREV